ncbi:hypothetical protein C2869_18975 [Saccharobesus litoralis]|uniref:Periplasmic chaperone PpiD n=1 Tax=Saccharobesus litoralis TaxID=2172099 RepID=A0A2S0VW14_9ALTE|nr:SurA N-terminal domain-containing protein [Saccharobesus litoralis]AWB68362.1 hypothetical protein C2869_18975 [Saccharobesus litoralis]
MLERIRESSQGVAAKIILGLVIASFAVAGVGSYINTKGDIPAAEVNGVAISQMEFDRAYQNERARMERQFGEMFAQLASDENYLKNFRSGILDRLVNQELSDQLADELGLRVGDDQVKQYILDMPEFQVDGKFNNDRFQSLLMNARYSPGEFSEMLRTDMQRRQLLTALTGSEFTLESEAKQFVELQEQTRDFAYAEVNLEQFKDGIVVEDSELEQHYQANLESYRTPEQVALNYIDLRVDDLMEQVSIDESEVLATYEGNPAAYTREERRRASHILVSLGDDEEAAKKKAQDLLAKVNAGEDFAALAKENSDDTFSGENGGDLDFFGKGVMAPEFEEATFALAQAGDVSELVKTTFGYHIIKLTDIEPQSVQPFDEVKAEIEQNLKRDKANLLFGEKQQLIADLAFEVSDSLHDAASEAGVEVKSTGLFSQATAPSEVNNPLILNKAFSAEVAQNGYNSEVIELGADRIVVVRASEYKESRIQSLDEVKSQIENQVIADKAKQAAEAWAQDVSSEWATADIAQKITEKGAELKTVTAVGRNSSDVGGQIKRKAFAMAKPTAEQASVAWTQFANSIAVIKLNGVTVADKAADDAAKQRLTSAYSDSNYRALLDALRDNSSIETPVLTSTDS